MICVPDRARCQARSQHVTGPNKDKIKLFSYLICGANVDAQDKNGKTVLHFAVENRKAKIVQLLLVCGANVDTEGKGGKTVLPFAVEKRQDKIIQLHLVCGANVDAEDKDGKTVLHFAV